MTASAVPLPPGVWSSRSTAPTGAEDVGLVRPVLIGLSLAWVAGLFVFAGELRRGEAGLSALLTEAAGIADTWLVGSSVLFAVDGQVTGYEITLGCTAAFLMVPFSLVTAVLLGVRRVPVGRALLSLAVAVATVVAVNQLRLAAIAAGMAEWGPGPGYARTHLLLGTAISTVGVVLAGTAYLAVLLRGTFVTPGHRSVAS